MNLIVLWFGPSRKLQGEEKLCHVGFTSYWQHMSKECWKTAKVIVADYSTPVSYMIITNLHLRDHSSYPRILPSFFAVLKCLYVFPVWFYLQHAPIVVLSCWSFRLPKGWKHLARYPIQGELSFPSQQCDAGWWYVCVDIFCLNSILDNR